jgi:predicted DNA-binding transcriptional regulator AlpA
MVSIETKIQPRYLRPKDAARYLGFSKSTLFRIVKAGLLNPGTKIFTNCTVWSIEDLDQFVLDARNRANQANNN